MAEIPGAKPSRWWGWLAVAVMVKLVYLAIFVHINQQDGLLSPGSWLMERGDSFSYVESADNCLEHGRYGYDLSRPPTWAGRMPGYAFVYLPLRFVLPRALALKGCAVLQAALGGVAVYVLAITAMTLTGSRRAFVVTYWGALSSAYVSSWDYRALTESWASSAAIFSVCALVSSVKAPRAAGFLLAGLFSGWCVFLRPAFFPLLPLLAAVVFWNLRLGVVRSTRQAGAWALAFLLPFLAMDAAWIARNAVLLSRFVPLQYDENAGYLYSRSFLALVKFVKAWGGDYVAWNPKAEIRWFDEEAGVARKDPPSYEPAASGLPGWVHTSRYDRLGLLALRETYLKAHDVRLTEAARERFDQQATATLAEYTEAFRNEKPWRYYFWAPLRLTKLYLLHSGTYNLFGRPAARLSGGEWAFKGFQSAIYLACVLLGIPAAVWLWLRALAARRATSALLPASVCLYFSLVFPLVLRRAEYRYFVVGFPFALLCAVIAYEGILAHFASHRSSKDSFRRQPV